MTDVVWSSDSLQHLRDIERHIAADSAVAARRFAHRLIEAGESLSILPDRGRPVGDGTRELTGLNPYVLRYVHNASAQMVTIIAIWHGARDGLP